jgi:hypothetical protein
MLNFHGYVYLRYVLLINIITALPAAMEVRGRANDPLLHASWWGIDQHSAVMVVALAALLGSVLVCIATRNDFRKWWVFVICGVIVGDFSPTFYLLTAPNDVNLPLGEMYVSGTFWGVVAGVVLTMVLGRRKPTAAA